MPGIGAPLGGVAGRLELCDGVQPGWDAAMVSGRHHRAETPASSGKRTGTGGAQRREHSMAITLSNGGTLSAPAACRKATRALTSLRRADSTKREGEMDRPRLAPLPHDQEALYAFIGQVSVLLVAHNVDAITVTHVFAGNCGSRRSCAQPGAGHADCLSLCGSGHLHIERAAL